MRTLYETDGKIFPTKAEAIAYEQSLAKRLIAIFDDYVATFDNNQDNEYYETDRERVEDVLQEMLIWYWDRRKDLRIVDRVPKVAEL